MFYRGLSPAEAEFSYLNTARTLELYGVEFHYARVSEENISEWYLTLKHKYSVKKKF